MEQKELKVFHPDRVNEQVVKARYEVRGRVVIEANSILEQISQAKQKGQQQNPFPFEQIVFCNIGNPQQLKQKPLTFVRQVTCLMEYPHLIDVAPNFFFSDAVERAKKLLSECQGTGPYSHSLGVPIIRKDVADFISQRDGYKCSPDTVFLCDGASSGVKLCLSLLVKNLSSGVMIPLPGYPLYSASLTLFGGAAIPYYLEEGTWELKISELEKSYQQAVQNGIDVRGLVIINPNNPTGVMLTSENMKAIIHFCSQYHIVLFADEVYQANVYNPEQFPFVSFRKLALEIFGTVDIAKKLELVSFHSVSKGFLGECGKRGGFFQLEGVLPSILSELYKLSSISLCPNVVGQIVTDVMVNPPKIGDPSFELYSKERDEILGSLKRRAIKLSNALNSLEGFQCSLPYSSMYLFPKISLSEKAVKAAKDAGENPDTFYCLELLKSTGICVVPGSGFGQRDGTYHFRTTFLPPEDQIDNVIERMKHFNTDFMNKFK